MTTQKVNINELHKESATSLISSIPNCVSLLFQSPIPSFSVVQSINDEMETPEDPFNLEQDQLIIEAMTEEDGREIEITVHTVRKVITIEKRQ